MLKKEELIEIIREKESKNYKRFEKIYISPKWTSPNYVFDTLDRRIFDTDCKEKGWFVYIHRADICGWAIDCDCWIVYDKDNIIEAISLDCPPKGIQLEEIFI